jgi:F420-0:gamma-glutamyl ligase
MIVAAFKTPPVTPGMKLVNILDTCLPALEEGDIVVVTSKIISICEGRVVKKDDTTSKDDLVKKEAAQLIAKRLGKYDIYLTIKNNTLIANAGIDESNAGGYFILWPKAPNKTAEDLWQHLKAKHKISRLGVLITDSYLAPLRWGTRGFGLAWCGFEPLKNYIGTPDVFGRNLHMTQASLLDGLGK